MLSPYYTIGLMSGTSLDGIDAVLLCQTVKSNNTIKTSKPVHIAMPDALINVFRILQNTGENELGQSAWAGIELAKYYAKAVNALLKAENINAADIAAIGAHGQTVRHRPLDGYSIQIINGAWLAELTGINVVCDFRARDIAAGGQGAPLIPAFHQALIKTLTSSQKNDDERLPWGFLNLGGMANVTIGIKDKLIAGDCGPANVLIDAWFRLQHSTLCYDEGGKWASTGTVNKKLLSKLMEHPYFKQPLPKSCGYEEFNISWLQGIITAYSWISAKDIQATLVELSAISVANFISTLALPHIFSTPYDNFQSKPPLWVFGGGIYNNTLMSRLTYHLPNWILMTSDIIGIHPQAMEAAAFAWLAAQTMKKQPSNSATVSGALGAKVLGAVHFA